MAPSQLPLSWFCIASCRCERGTSAWGAWLQVKEDVYEKMDKELLSYVEDVLLNRCSNGTERLLAYAETIEPKCKPCAVRKKGVAAVAEAAGGATWRDLPVTKRIEHALVKGLDTYIVSVRPYRTPCF